MKYKKNFLWKNIRNFFRKEFFIFRARGWELSHVALNYTTLKKHDVLNSNYQLLYAYDLNIKT